MIKLFEEVLEPYKKENKVIETYIYPMVTVSSKYWDFDAYHAVLVFDNSKKKFNKNTRIFLLGDLKLVDLNEREKAPTIIEKAIMEVKSKLSNLSPDPQSLSAFLSNIDNYEVVGFWMSSLTESKSLTFESPYERVLLGKSLREYVMACYWFPQIKVLGPKYFYLGKLSYKYDDVVSIHTEGDTLAIYNPYTGALWFANGYIKCGNWIVGPIDFVLKYNVHPSLQKKLADIQELIPIYEHDTIYFKKKKALFNHELKLKPTVYQRAFLKILKMGSENELKNHPIGKELYEIIEESKRQRGIVEEKSPKIAPRITGFYLQGGFNKDSNTG